MTVAVSGDSILNRRVSVCEDPEFRALMDHVQSSDLGFTHLETNLLEYGDSNVYPAAEAGGTWMRSPPRIADELKWAGFDLVSHASNHALDFSYGGLESTWRRLDDADISYAGTGRNLADARLPTYREVSGARIALVSMTTSFTNWSRAGEARRDVQGRPGVNPLEYHYEIDSEKVATITEMAEAMGVWITPEDDGTWLFNPPGLHNTVHRYVESDTPGVRRVLSGRDRKGNLQAIREGARQADVTIAHIHTHEWAADGELCDPPSFVRTFVKRCVDAGADIVVCQGSHTPLRGIERYGDGVVFYDPGDLFAMSDTVERLPSEFFYRYGTRSEAGIAGSTPGEGLAARGVSDTMSDETDPDANDGAYGGAALNPRGGYHSGAVTGTIIPVCEFDDDMGVDSIELHPGVLRNEPALYDGVPVHANGDRAREIIEHVADLSTPFDTRVSYEDGYGLVAL